MVCENFLLLHIKSGKISVIIFPGPLLMELHFLFMNVFYRICEMNTLVYQYVFLDLLGIFLKLNQNSFKQSLINTFSASIRSSIIKLMLNLKYKFYQIYQQYVTKSTNDFNYKLTFIFLFHQNTLQKKANSFFYKNRFPYKLEECTFEQHFV